MAENQNSNQKPEGHDAKAGLSWSQPQSTTNAARATPVQSKPAAAQTSDSSGRVISIIIGIVIILALAAWGIVALRHNSGTATTATSTDETSTTTDSGVQDTQGSVTTTPGTGSTTNTSNTGGSTTMGTANFSVAAQPAGDSVAVSGMNLSQPTWIIVYESRNGKPGNILGAGLYFAGDTSASVPLMRGTTAGQTYYVTAAIDNGDKLFSAKDETPVLDSTGAQVWTTFQAQ